MTQSTTSHPAKKLNLPHGDASTDAIDIDDILCVQVIPGGDGGWRILIILKNGSGIVAAHTDENVGYLKGIGFEPQYLLGHPATESKPKGAKM